MRVIGVSLRQKAKIGKILLSRDCADTGSEGMEQQLAGEKKSRRVYLQNGEKRTCLCMNVNRAGYIIAGPSVK